MILKRLCLSVAIFLSSFQILAAVESDEVYLPEEARVYIKFMLNAYGKSDEDKIEAFDQAYGFLFKYWNLESGEVEPQSLEEYVQYVYGQHPRFLNLNNEVQFFTDFSEVKRFKITLTDEALKLKAGDYHGEQVEMLRAYFDLIKTQMGFVKESENFQYQNSEDKFFHAFELALQNWPHNELKGLQFLELHPVEQMDSRFKLAAVNSFELVFERILDEMRNSGRKVGHFFGDKGSPEITRSVELMISSYFDNETEGGLKNMISGAVDRPSLADPVDRFGIVLQFAAPQLLKLLQVVARERGFGAEVAEVLSKLEDGVLSAPWPSLKPLLMEELDDLEDAGILLDIESGISQKPLAAGTVAQIHRGRVAIKGDWGGVAVKEVVFRFIKPGIRQRAEEGREIFAEVAKVLDNDPILQQYALPKLEPVVDDLYMNIVNDLDVNGSAKRQKRAKELYTYNQKLKLGNREVQLNFRPPEVYYAIPDGNLMIQELVSGSKLESIYEDHPEVARGIVGAIGDKWIHEALFQTGFFHADMHQGNFLISGGPTAFDILILDFGMGGVLRWNLRRAFFGMMVSAVLDEEELLAEMAWEFRDPERTKLNSKSEFKERLYSRLDHYRANGFGASKDQRAVTYLSSVLEVGIKFDSELAGMIRGVGVQQRLTAFVEQEKGFDAMVIGLLHKKPWLAYKILKPNGLLPSGPKKKLFAAIARKVDNYFGVVSGEVMEEYLLMP